jgi:hypothetical protein
MAIINILQPYHGNDCYFILPLSNNQYFIAMIDAHPLPLSNKDHTQPQLYSST